ncbi:alpha/beta hydrolase fold domain-containing protein [Cryptosporangium sp. NPDC051539]|uniref:alpha/beta hydrolase fold domain-containing protein n=1 Tax=Cryptosporangium sp. NPDC051539 TaxID=3363962 RepID=UPI0037B8B0AF
MTTSNALADLYRRWSDETVALAGGRLSPITLTRYQNASWIDLADESAGVHYRDIDVDGLHGLSARPDDAPRGPVILYFHGGGYLGGSSGATRKLTGHLAAAAGTSLLSIDYRLAPEHPFPAQLDDAVTAWNWLVSHDYHPAEQVVLAGDSAGGLLATVLAQYLRDKGLGRPAAVVAFSPFYDIDGHSSTYDENQGRDLLATRAAAQALLPLIAGGADEPYLTALSGGAHDLPPMYLAFGADEALLGGGREFKEQADAAGTDVELDVYAGQQHVFQYMAGRDIAADTSIARAGEFVRRALPAVTPEIDAEDKS